MNTTTNKDMARAAAEVSKAGAKVSAEAAKTAAGYQAKAMKEEAADALSAALSRRCSQQPRLL